MTTPPDAALVERAEAFFHQQPHGHVAVWALIAARFAQAEVARAVADLTDLTARTLAAEKRVGEAVREAEAAILEWSAGHPGDLGSGPAVLAALRALASPGGGAGAAGRG